MKSRIVYLSLAWLLFAGISLLIPASSLPVKAQDGFANRMRERIKECQQDVLDAEIRMNNLQILIDAYPDTDKRGSAWENELFSLKNYKYDWLCLKLRDAEFTLALVYPPTPSPTPTPSPATSPTPKDSKDKKKLTPEEEELIERWRKLRERLPKLSAEINDWVKEKKKKSPPKPPDIPVWRPEGNDSWENITTFESKIGKIKLRLPNDIRHGDTITGTVTAEPKGDTEEERKKNEAELKKYGIEIIIPRSGGVPIPTGLDPIDDTAYWRAASLNTAMNFLITDDSSLTPVTDLVMWISLTKNDPQTNIPIELVQLSLVSTRPINVTPPTADGTPWQMPQIVQAGRPIEIHGPFDGNASNTSVTFGDKTLPVLAESPRGCIIGGLAYAQGNDMHLGPGEIKVSEDGKQKTIPIRTVGLNLTSPKTHLSRGEKTDVNIQVFGLNGLLDTEIVPLQLVSSGVINMAGGDSQSLQIRKRDVDQNGVFRTTRQVTGHSTGGWGVTATVIDPRWRPIYIPLILNSKGNGFRRQPGDGKAQGFFDIFDVRDPRDGKPLNGEHKLEYQCEGKTPTLSKIPYIGRLFMNNGKSKVETQCLLMITPRIIIQDE